MEQQQQNEKTKSAVKKRLVKSRRPTQQKSEQGENTDVQEVIDEGAFEVVLPKKIKRRKNQIRKE